MFDKGMVTRENAEQTKSPKQAPNAKRRVNTIFNHLFNPPARSRCIIAVELGSEGGTVHQVKIAKAQGRKVFALKPKRENKRALEGFKLFMSMDATPIDSMKPVEEYLKTIPNGKLREKKIDSFYQNTISSFRGK